MKQVSTGAFVVSMIILCLFGASVLGFAPGLTEATAKLLETAVTLVIGYWLGSSAGSAAKDARLADRS